MIEMDKIRLLSERIAREFHPERIILFGSYAYGTPTADSDVDLMVVMPHRGSGPRTATRIRLACPRTFPMDLIVRTPAEVRRRLDMGDSFLREVTSKGIVLHEASDARVDR